MKKIFLLKKNITELSSGESVVIDDVEIIPPEAEKVPGLPEYIDADLWHGYLKLRDKLKDEGQELSTSALQDKITRLDDKGYDCNKLLMFAYSDSQITVLEPRRQDCDTFKKGKAETYTNWLLEAQLRRANNKKFELQQELSFLKQQPFDWAKNAADEKEAQLQTVLDYIAARTKTPINN